MRTRAEGSTKVQECTFGRRKAPEG